MTNLSLTLHILLLFHFPKGSRNKLQNMRNSADICHTALGTVQQLVFYEPKLLFYYPKDLFFKNFTLHALFTNNFLQVYTTNI